jgi:hypothetical protein
MMIGRNKFEYRTTQRLLNFEGVIPAIKKNVFQDGLSAKYENINLVL